MNLYSYTVYSKGSKAPRYIYARTPSDAISALYLKINRLSEVIELPDEKGAKFKVRLWTQAGNWKTSYFSVNVLGVLPEKVNYKAMPYLLKDYRSDYASLVDRSDGRLFAVNDKQLMTLAKSKGVIGVYLAGKRFVGLECIEPSAFVTGTPQIDYRVIKFFNRLCLELADIPREVERLVEKVNAKESYAPSCGGSGADYASGLASDYYEIEALFPPKEFAKVMRGTPSKFTSLFEEFRGYADRQRWERVPASDTFYTKLLTVSALPSYFMEYIKDDLYCLR